MSNVSLSAEDMLQTYGGCINNNLVNLIDNIDEEDEISLIKQSPYYDLNQIPGVIGESENNFLILSLNAQSINAKISHLQAFVYQLSQSNISADVICIQESWLPDNADTSLVQLDGYTCVSQGHICSSHGGLITYIHSKYKYKNLNIYTPSNIWEGLFLEISGGDLTRSIIVGNIYKPPKNNNNNENIEIFTEEITPVLDSFRNTDKDILLAGDYNINLLKINEREKFTEFLDKMINNSFFPKITLPTRFSTHSCSLLDNIFCKLSANCTETNAGVIHTNISDHLPCFVKLKLIGKKNKQPTRFTKQKIDVSKAMKSFIQDLKSQNIYHKLNPTLESDPNDNYEILSNTVKETKLRHFPTRMVKYNKRRHKNNKWISYGIINSIKSRDIMYLELKRTPVNDGRYLTLKHNLNVFNNILKKAIREAKVDYYNSLFDKYKHDVRNTWKSISEVLHKANRQKKSIEKIIHDGRCITDTKEIADSFNNFFVNIGPSLAAKIATTNKKPYTSYLTRVIHSSFHFKSVDEDNVCKIIKSLQSKTSFGHDGISTKLLKNIAPVILTPLTLIINQSLITGIFPTELKIAKVIPLHKKDDPAIMDNFRPVSLLTAISKVFEKVAHTQLNDYFTQNKLFYPSQYGFRPDHSTELAALELVDRIHTDLDNKKCSVAIFMDLSKAFDTLDHDILLTKLQHYGIKNIELQWFHSYLTGRSQFVEINGAKSDMSTITTGVPQGSILGPLLFLIYMNDIPEASILFKSILYADDTSLLHAVDLSVTAYVDTDVNLLNSELDKIYDWLAVNRLSLNVKKTKFMVFHYHNKRITEISIKINSIELERVTNFDFLGLTINENLSWKSQTNKIANKITKFIGVLNRLKHYLPERILYTLYCSMIQSHISYSILTWGFELNRLEKLQKRAIRVIACARYNAHTEPIFKYFKTLKIKNIFELNILKFYYKLSNCSLPVYFSAFKPEMSNERHSYNTRLQNYIPGNVTRTRFAQNCLRNKLPALINSTENRVLSKLSTHSFKAFTNYAKNNFIEKYSLICTVQNCRVCQQL